MIRRPPRSTPLYSSAASDVYKRQGLGGGDGRAALRPRQSHRHRRPQQASAIRLARRRAGRAHPAAGPGRARRQVDRLRVARPRGERPRHGRHPAGPRGGGPGRRPADRRHRPHDQGKGCLLHGGPLLLAHPDHQAGGVRDGDGRSRRAHPRGGRRRTMTLPMGRPMREGFGETVAAIADDDPRVVMLDGDVGSSTRADIFEKAHPDRYLQMGIAEQNMLGVAAGMATMGLIPFISTFVSFAVVRSLDQIRVLIAQTGLNVKITPGYAGLFTGQTGMSHIIVDDMSIMRSMPGMVTVSPADDVEAAQALRWAAAYEGPCYVRLVRDATQRLFDDTYHLEIGKAVVVRDGIDVPAIVAAAGRTGRVITVEEHSVIGGLGGAVAEVLSEHRPTVVHRIGLQDVDVQSGTNDALLDIYGLSAARVAEQVRALVGAG